MRLEDLLHLGVERLSGILIEKVRHRTSVFFKFTLGKRTGGMSHVGGKLSRLIDEIVPTPVAVFGNKVHVGLFDGFRRVTGPAVGALSGFKGFFRLHLLPLKLGASLRFFGNFFPLVGNFLGDVIEITAHLFRPTVFFELELLFGGLVFVNGRIKAVLLAVFAGKAL